MKKYSIYFLLFLFSGIGIYAQKAKIDSLYSILNTNIKDTTKVQILHQLALASDSVSFSFKGLELAKKIGYKRGIAISLLDIGRHYYFGGQQDLALDYLIKAIKAGEAINNKKVLISAYRYIGFVYRGNDPYKAEDYYKKSLQLCRETGDEIAASYALSAIGNIYEGASEKKDRALKYYLESLNIRERKGSYDEIASSLNETSRIYDLMGLYNKTILLRIRGLEIAEKSGSTENIVSLTHVIGNDYAFRLHDYKRGLEYQLKAYELGKTLKNNFDIMYSINIGIANVYYNLGDFKKSAEYFKESRHLNDSINFRAAKYNNNLSQIKHNLEEELEKQKLLLKDSEIEKVLADAKRQTTLRNAFLIGFALVFIFALFIFKENKQKQKAIKELDLRNREIEMAYQTLAVSEGNFKQITETINDVFYLYNIVRKKYEYISPNCEKIFGLKQDYFYKGKSTKIIVHKDDLQLVVDANTKVDSGIAYDIEYRILVDDKIKWIAEKSSPIFDKYGSLVRNSGICRDITLRKANAEMIARKNKDIMDSILYARTIQDAVLVPKKEIAAKLNDFFILSKPKDIVSGDFYFYKETKKGIFLAVADCTGHGVPAGFLSMIGNAFLNEIVTLNENVTPAQVLDELSDMIIKSLNQNRKDSESKDGMDIAVIYFENNTPFIQYAGAHNSLYLVRNGELNEHKADLFPVGISETGTVAPFKNNTIKLEKGDALYIFSDGFADQFGGAQGRKFMKRQMRDLFTSIYAKPMSEQEEILDKTFTEWKGEFNQVDDVLIIGVKV